MADLHHHHVHHHLCFCDFMRLLWSLAAPCALLTLVLTLVLGLLLLGLRLWLQSRRRSRRRKSRAEGGGGPAVAFFHPDCSAGGGGERVLWSSLRVLMLRFPDVSFVVYAADQGVAAEQILEGVRQRFSVTLPRPITFIFLRHGALVEATSYPHFTLLGQSAGSMLLGWEALTAFVPDLYVDSMGFAFTLPIFRYLGGCAVACYVHFPTVSTDMLSVVREPNPRSNPAFLSRSPVLGAVKLVYYGCFALLYGLAGSCSHVIMVNSTWTLGHILALWRSPSRTSVVYPPCDVRAFLDVPLEDEVEEGWVELGEELVSGEEEGGGRKCQSVVSVAQFRPEKDHRLQIQAFSKLLDRKGEGPGGRESLRLVLIGGCRNQEDEDRVLMLRGFCEELGVSDRVDFKLNVPFEELQRELVSATIGLHTMRNEHFGIGVVECMAAGTIVLAHKSGGPELDIVVPYEGGQTGFLADSEDSYAAAMETILALAPADKLEIRRNARRSVERFSNREFEACFLAAMEPLLSKLER
ncbi:GDP-Man:Man(3)GlcNAc(2)-PP-Dol alpha-1,2-mannosyltransferase-like isoform X2 [Platichthys flesus]|uniref:GDP-Man:Man(3)GlcNAc(2)-PP-Dol alpha-1,2-mannosyltransferase-like isoform X2 n=1 Tax=Platichthys flesus TaxID=8260 RepID=UPI002DBDA2E8|nr:GDP-Man:Man(3)GlcNAc(2)-PP-Dol alpha-1,2-mannosyltransferase-like isoform X2 [Platichthys flesus]